MSKHTPGPWRISEIYRNGAVEGTMIECGPRGDGGSFVCMVMKGREDADCRLIEAAPDHATVLRLMVLGVLRWEPFRGGSDRGELCFAGIRYFTQLDEFGCPILTDHLRSVLAKREGGAA